MFLILNRTCSDSNIGEDIGNIQFWRGDKSPQSAFTYLQNKGDLNRELAVTNEKLTDLLRSMMEEDDDE